MYIYYTNIGGVNCILKNMSMPIYVWKDKNPFPSNNTEPIYTIFFTGEHHDDYKNQYIIPSSKFTLYNCSFPINK